MYVAHLSLADFRSYPEVELPLDAGVTAIIGPNGYGKTNLIEAINYLATLGSHRVAHDTPLIRLGSERAVVRVQVITDNEAQRSALLEIEITAGRSNRARINRAPAGKPRDVLGILQTVLFAPEDLALVKGDPAGRRRFLDDLLVARAPRFAAVRADYDRILKQRNALLKTAGHAMRASKGGSGAGDLRTLEVWDEHLAGTGAELIVARLELIETIRPLVGKAYDAVATSSATSGSVASVEARLTYQSSLGPEVELVPDRALMAPALLETISGLRRDEVERGVSLVGPHRDDLVLSLGPLPAKGYASQGEAWSFALALRLASFDLLRSDGSDPVLILDDVFSELDTHRRTRLAELVSDAEQVLITAAVAEDIPAVLTGNQIDVPYLTPHLPKE